MAQGLRALDRCGYPVFIEGRRLFAWKNRVRQVDDHPEPPKSLSLYPFAGLTLLWFASGSLRSRKGSLPRSSFPKPPPLHLIKRTA